MKMAATMNATEHNNLPVLYNVTSGTVILSQHRHYVYIYNIFPYNEAIQWCKNVNDIGLDRGWTELDERERVE